MTAIQLIQGFDLVNFILSNYDKFTTDQLSRATGFPKYKIVQLCRELSVRPSEYPKEPLPDKKVVFRKHTNVYERSFEDGVVRKPIARPKASYDNIPSPYGIFTEMMKDQTEEELLKKHGL